VKAKGTTVRVEVKRYAVEKDGWEFGDALAASMSDPMGELCVKERYL
jgi:hypothetical protein